MGRSRKALHAPKAIDRRRHRSYRGATRTPLAVEADMISELMRCLAAAILLVDHAFAACEGPDEGEATTVVTVPANENVDVFHYRATPLASVVEFCVREPGTDWILVASHAAYQSKWSLLQSWTYPKTVQIKTTAIIDDDLSPFKTQTRLKTTYGFSFSWFDGDSAGANDQVVYCLKGGAGCPASRRTDFPE